MSEQPSRQDFEDAILARLERKSSHDYQWPRWAAAYEASCAVTDLLDHLGGGRASGGGLV